MMDLRHNVKKNFKFYFKFFDSLNFVYLMERRRWWKRRRSLSKFFSKDFIFLFYFFFGDFCIEKTVSSRLSGSLHFIWYNSFRLSFVRTQHSTFFSFFVRLFVFHLQFTGKKKKKKADRKEKGGKISMTI
jgi:hypothetical protein